MQLSGRVRLGTKTKNLVKNLTTGEIAVIKHQDLDYLAAQSLLEAGVKAVVNAKASISGKYPNLGPQKILAAKIPIIDQVGDNIFKSLNSGEKIKIKDGNIIKRDKVIATGDILTLEGVESRLQETRANLETELSKFIDNTLDYAKKEKNLILDLDIPKVNTDLQDRDVLIVVRGKDYRQDLEAVSSYIKQVNPVLIGVDGGADALVEYGFEPDIIIGDMDSVSDEVLASGAELIVHAYPDGKAPGMERIRDLNLEARKFPAPGTSEDIAMLLGYEQGAELIVAVGTHTHMIDFLEKGRPGMASTFLVRLKVGNKLVDAKGVNKLYNTRLQPKHLAQLMIASLIPIIAISIVSPPVHQIFKLLMIKLRFSLGF
ncbi:putative cytokinetic ring protein SteA [Halanaerocella petrolearia]